MASRAGEVRRFDYDLKVEAPTLPGAVKPGETFDLTGQSPIIRGHKRLTYNRRANPWRQLTELTLTAMPFMPPGSQAVLKLDTRFIANRGVALVRLVQQENQPNALLDMASFALFMARVVINIHAWTFRQPDTAPITPPRRLPGPLQGLPKPRVTELLVARRIKRADAVVRLTRYPNIGSSLPPLVMIHGYSVSGTTFAHPSLQPSAAEFFWRQGRDVWLA